MSGLLEIWAKYYKEGRGVCNSSRMISLVFLYKGWDSYSKCMRMGNFCHVLEFECAGARIWLPLLLSSEFLPGRRLSVMLMQLLVQPLFFFVLFSLSILPLSFFTFSEFAVALFSACKPRADIDIDLGWVYFVYFIFCTLNGILFYFFAKNLFLTILCTI